MARHPPRHPFSNDPTLSSKFPNSLWILQYWLAIYCTILIEEHFIFRKARWSNYNAKDYLNPNRLPLGIAAAVSMGIGVMGAVLGTTVKTPVYIRFSIDKYSTGMATLWYIGILGKKSQLLFFVSVIRDSQLVSTTVGDPAFGGDIGFELSMGFTMVSYPILRFIERKFEGPERRGEA